MGNDQFREQSTYACCLQCVKKGDSGMNIQFLSVEYYDHREGYSNIGWAKVMYKCEKGHLFCTHELKDNFISRAEVHNTQLNEIAKLKKKVAELEKTIENLQGYASPSAPVEVIAMPIGKL